MLAATPDLLINEIHFDPTFGDDDVDLYFEVRGAPNATISAGTYLVVVEGDGEATSETPGDINSVFDLGGLTLGSNGFLVVAEGGSGYSFDSAATVLQGTSGFGGLPGNRYQDDATLSDRFEFIFDSNSFLLVQTGIAPLPDQDMDIDDDGILDGNAAGWSILDGVTVLGTHVSGSPSDVTYGNIAFRAGGNTAVVPEGVTVVDVEHLGYVARVGASTGWSKSDWVGGQTRELTSGAFDFELDAITGNEAYRDMIGFDLDHVGGHNFFSTVSGTKFYDSNGNGVRNGGEPAIVGETVYIDYNDNGWLDSFETIVEPDDFADGTIITNAVPGVTLTVTDEFDALLGFDIASEVDSVAAPTGTRVFSHGTRRLRMDFLQPVESVTIDFSGLTPSTYKGLLEAYDAAGNLLDTYSTATLSNAFETMTISRPTAEIAYAIAYPDDTVSPFGDLDNLRFTRPEPSAVTDANGGYQIDHVADHLQGTSTINIREVTQTNIRQTTPGGDGSHSALIDKAMAIGDLDFGGESSRPLDIIGRVDDGQWWTARSDATAFSAEHWGSWSPSVTWDDVHSGDVDGDGNADLVGRTGAQLWVSRSNGEYFINEFWGWLPASSNWKDVLLADVNGDGLNDVVGRHNGDWWVARSDGSSFVVEQWGHWSDFVVWDDVHVGDFNGDGRDDIAGRTGGQWWLAKSNGARFLIEFWSQWASSVTWNDVNVGDYNGDGNDDLAGRAGDFWYVAISDGTRFNPTQSWARWTTLVTWEDVRVADFDGDGNDDVAGRVNGIWYVGKSNGNGFNTNLWGRWSNLVTWADVQVADFDGDGKDDIAGRTGGQWWLAHSNGTVFSIELWGRWSDINWSDVRVGRFGALGAIS